MSSFNHKILAAIDEFLLEHPGEEHTSLEIASYLYHQRKLEPQAKSQIQLLAKDVSRAMSTQTIVDEKGRKVRKKLCLKRRVTNPDGSTYVQATWFDKDYAPPTVKEAIFDQRRESAVNIVWQLKQDIDHYNEFDNPGAPYQTTFDFIGDMADREAGLHLIMESQEEEEDYLGDEDIEGEGLVSLG
jgi:hypothetical protein